jgi:hemoglobin/transferrin/lactoferrin receptor protein
MSKRYPGFLSIFPFKVLVVLWIGIITQQIALAQEVTVVSKRSKKGIEFAEIIHRESQQSWLTDATGKTQIPVLDSGAILQFRALGFKPQTCSYNDLTRTQYRIALEPSQLNLEEVVVSATRFRDKKSEVPMPIITISQADNLLENPQTAADLLETSGKVFIQKSQQGGGSPMIRGFATNRLIYTVDGVRMNTAIFRSGNIQNVINLDPFAVESTEVLFGPGSVMYGSDAIGGVMSFQTLQPSFSTTEKLKINGSLLGRYASASNERTGHFDLQLKGNRWASVTSVSSWDYDHLRQGRNGPDDYLKTSYVQRINEEDVIIEQDNPLLQIPSAYSQVNVMQKLRFKPHINWDFTYGFHYSTTSSYGRYDRHNRVRNGQPRYAEWKYGPQSWLMNHLLVNYTGRSAFYDQIKIHLAQQSFKESRIDRDFGRVNRRIREEGVEAYSINFDLKKILSPAHTLHYGAEYIRNDVASSGRMVDISNDESVDGPARYPESVWTTVGIYGNETWKLSDKLSLHSGLRYTQFILDADFRNNLDFYPLPFEQTRINNGSLTGSLGAIFRPSKAWVIRANAGTAFRAPNVDDIGKIFDSEPGAVIIPNPDLESEYAYNFDLSATTQIGDLVELDFSVYYTQLRDALVRRNARLNGRDSILYDGQLSQVQEIQNAAETRIYGIQAGAKVQLLAPLYLITDMNYQDGVEKTIDGMESAVRHVPPFFGISRLKYETSRLTLEINAQYQGEFSHQDLAISERGKTDIYALDANGNTYAPAWYTLNFNLLFTLSPRWTLSGGVENLTDQRYRPYSSGISGAGRNFIITAKVNL